MELQGWCGNTNIWYPGNGAGAKIFTSNDKNLWNEVGVIPSQFAGQVIKVNVKPSKASFLKFIHDGYIGFGYVNILN